MTEDINKAVSPEATLQDVSPPSGVKEAQPEAVAEITKDFGFLPILPHLRYHENRAQKFGIVLQLTFVAATTFSEWYDVRPL